MNIEEKNKMKKIIKEAVIYTAVALLIWGGITLLSYSKGAIVGKVAFGVFAKAIGIIIAIFLILGLIQVWIPPQKISKFLGKEAGWKALIFASTIPMIIGGPLFVMFPLLKVLKDKGASIAVILTFITAWGAKAPLLPLEAEFLGWHFALLRIIFIIPLAFCIGIIGELIIEKKHQLKELEETHKKHKKWKRNQ